MRALLTGGGERPDRLAEVLARLGWQVVRAPDAGTARLCGDEALLVTVAPDHAEDPAATLDEIALAPVRLAQALAAVQPVPVRDAAGELQAPAQVVHVLDRAALVPGCADLALATASAALVAAARVAALTLAPRLRVNILAIDATADPGPALGWLLSAHAVTGQTLHLGQDPRPATGWRRDAAPIQP